MEGSVEEFLVLSCAWSQATNWPFRLIFLKIGNYRPLFIYFLLFNAVDGK